MRLRRRKKYNTLKQSSSRAFALRGAGDSLRVGFSYGEVRGRDKTLPLVSKLFTGETKKESHLSFLEFQIPILAEAGDREGLRNALKEYALLWVRLERGNHED